MCVYVCIYIYIYVGFKPGASGGAALFLSCACNLKRSLCSQLVATAESASHRNERAKRKRARRVVRIVKLGCTVGPSRFAGVSRILASHHGTRGSDPMTNGQSKNKGKKVEITKADGFIFTGRPIKPGEWQCQKCSKDCSDPRGYWVWAKNSECNQCHAKRPNKPRLFADTKWGQEAAKHGGGSASGGGAASGGGGETASQKKIRELEKQLAEKKNQDRIRRLEADIGSSSSGGDDAEEATGSADETKEHLDAEVEFTRQDVQDAQKRYDARKKAGCGVDNALSVLEAAKAAHIKAQQAVRDSKDPQEQLRSKSTKANRELAAKNKLVERLKDEMAEKKAAEEKAAKHQETINELIEKIETKRVEIDRLNQESFALQEQVVGTAPTGISDFVARTGQSMLTRLGDPLLANDESVKAKRTEVDTVLKGIHEALTRLEAIDQTVQKGLETAKEAAAKEAETAATEAENKAKAADTARKAAEAAKPAEASEPSQSGQIPASGSRPARRKTVVLDAAMAKPIHDRDEDEVLATARAGKLAKTTDGAADLELANV